MRLCHGPRVERRRSSALLNGFLVLVLSAPIGCEAPPGPETVVIEQVTRCTKSRPAPALPERSVEEGRESFFAAHPLPEVAYRGGPILDAPRIIGVFFADDPLQDLTVSFLQSYGCSEPFRSAVNEYGVGDAIYARTVVLPEHPELAASEIGRHEVFESWLREQVQTRRFGVIGAQDLLMFFAPSWAERPANSHVVYHGEVSPLRSRAQLLEASVSEPDPGSVRYALVGRPEVERDRYALEARTYSASQQLIAAALNPYPSSSPAWHGYQAGSAPVPQSVAYLHGFEESTDLCPDWQDASLDYPFKVARSYSNRRARAGQDPCYEGAAIPLLLGFQLVGEAGLDLSSGRAELSFDVYLGAARSSVQVTRLSLELRTDSGLYAALLVPMPSTAERALHDGDVAQLELDLPAISLPAYAGSAGVAESGHRLSVVLCFTPTDCTQRFVPVSALPPRAEAGT